MTFLSIMEDYDGDFPIPTKEDGGSTDINIPVDLDNQEVADSTADIVIDVSTRDPERQLRATDDRLEMLRRLQYSTQLARGVQLNTIGQESFSSVVKNGLTGILNVIGHIANLFKVCIFSGWRDFKRSELTDYCDSNSATMPRLYGIEYSSIGHVDIPYPEGMVGNYYLALQSLKQYLDDLDMLKRADRMVATVKAIHQDMHKVNSNFSSHVRDAQRTFTSPTAERLFKDTGRYFTGKKETVTADKFRNRFAGMGEYESTIKLCVQMDSHLRAVASVHARVSEIEGWLNRIMENTEKLDRTKIDDLVKIVRTLACTFDSYATVINDLSRVGHNLVHVTTTIRKAANM